MRRYSLTDVPAQQVLAVEPASQIGHDGILVVELHPLKDQQGQRTLFNADTPQDLLHWLGQSAVLLFVAPVHLNEGLSQVGEEIADGLQLATNPVVHQHEGFGHYNFNFLIGNEVLSMLLIMGGRWMVFHRMSYILI